MNENGQTGDAGESALRIFRAVEGQTKFLLNAESELKRIEGVEAKVAANKRSAVGNGIRLGDVRPEKVDDQMLQAGKQRVVFVCVVVHPETIMPHAIIRHGV